MVSGLFCKRKPYAEPYSVTTETCEVNGSTPYSPSHYEPGKLVQLKAGGEKWFVIRRETLRTLGPNPHTSSLTRKQIFPGDRTATDEPAFPCFCFYHRVNAAGGKIVIDSALVIGQVEVDTGKIYFPEQPAMRANGLECPTDPAPKSAQPIPDHSNGKSITLEST